jgi:hypothetical protein
VVFFGLEVLSHVTFNFIPLTREFLEKNRKFSMGKCLWLMLEKPEGFWTIQVLHEVRLGQLHDPPYF